VEAMYVIQVDEEAQQIFSPQQITSCASNSQGCGGGNPTDGFLYLHTVGLAQEVFWPFSGGLSPYDVCQSPNCTERCDRDLAQIYKYEAMIGPYAQVKSAHFAVPPCQDAVCDGQDLQGLALAVANIGPLSVAVNAKRWLHYTGGVMTYQACGNISMDEMDHAVQLVGFNRKASTPYWIVRNSWATTWGLSGYIYLEYGKNTCGVANLATYPELVTKEERWFFKGFEPRRLGEIKRDRFARLYKQASGEDF